jgi:hypothetical protein
MGGVDLANQLRAAYETHKSVFRSWFCIFTALLDIIIVNCYRISYLAAVQRGVPTTKLPEHADFRERLFMKLFAYASHPTIQMTRRAWHSKPPPIRIRARGTHEWGKRSKRGGCIQCRIDIGEEKRLLSMGLPVINIPHKDQSGRATATLYGCTQCNVALCKTRDCWERFHSKN